MIMVRLLNRQVSLKLKARGGIHYEGGKGILEQMIVHTVST